uniref:F-box domain-containing protein n=1 Tax=Oryza punctata TaxID=4537 RepID=A0A0E0LKL2_ORYPU
MVLVVKQHRCTHSASCVCIKGHLSEDALFLVFRHMNWNPRLIAVLSCVCKWFDEVAKQVLWKEFCHARAPKMMLDLHSGGSHIVDGNWKALGKLLIYCNGCTKGGLFNNIHVPGHFVFRTRFSRTAGKSFLPQQCRNDVLYVSDPCEHLDQGEEGDLGFFRGIFKSFATSRVKKMLIEKRARFHPSESCPYCKAKLWSMLEANMLPRSSSARLGAYEDSVEYFVCLNGHVIGIGTLLPLSDSEEVCKTEALDFCMLFIAESWLRLTMRECMGKGTCTMTRMAFHLTVCSVVLPGALHQMEKRSYFYTVISFIIHASSLLPPNCNRDTNLLSCPICAQHVMS